MGKLNMSKMLKDVRLSMSKHSPEILTGLGIAGMVSTVVLAVKATPKALLLKDEATYEKDAPLTRTEVVKTCWKCYIPTAIAGTTSIACLVGASAVSAKRNTALAAAYALTETALREYKDKVVEVIGEKKEKAVREAVAKDKMEQNPVSKTEVIVTNKGNALCFDPLSGRYFNTDHDKLRKAENEINARMLDEGCVALNEFYYEIGVDGTSVGENIGWNYNRDRLVKLHLGSMLSDTDIPCIVLDFAVAPYYGYDRY